MSEQSGRQDQLSVILSRRTLHGYREASPQGIPPSLFVKMASILEFRVFSVSWEAVAEFPAWALLGSRHPGAGRWHARMGPALAAHP